MRIVVFGDSMALPRNEGKDCVWWDETWPYMLQHNLVKNGKSVEVVNCSSRARTVDTLSKQDFIEHIEWKRPEVIILEVGIVDCSPRIFSRKEKAMINKRIVPVRIKNMIIKLRVKRRTLIIKRAPLAKVYTPPEQFKNYLEKFFYRLEELNQHIRLIVLPIIANDSFMEKKSPGFTSNVYIYNKILEEWCAIIGATWIDPTTLSSIQKMDAWFGSDGYHFNVTGHQRIANYLKEILNNDIKTQS